MSRQFARTARRAVLVLISVLTAVCMAAAASIVSPAAGSITYSDSLLVSVKLSDQKTVRITVYKEQIGKERQVFKEDGSMVTETVYSDYGADKLTQDDLALIAAGSKKDENGEDILLSTKETIPDFSDSVFAESVEYTNTSAGIGFYTKKLTGVAPGLYKVKVETLENSAVTETVINFAAVKEKKEEKQGIFANGTSSALQFLQNLLRNLFR